MRSRREKGEGWLVFRRVGRPAIRVRWAWGMQRSKSLESEETGEDTGKVADQRVQKNGLLPSNNAPYPGFDMERMSGTVGR